MQQFIKCSNCGKFTDRSFGMCHFCGKVYILDNSKKGKTNQNEVKSKKRKTEKP